MSRYLLVTAKIAAPALRKTAAALMARNPELDLEIIVLHCTVAALMSTEFIGRELAREQDWEHDRTLVIPGLCQGELSEIQSRCGAQVRRGPRDLRQLADFFHQRNTEKAVIPPSPLRIVAEIVDAPLLAPAQLLARAAYYRDSGAELIDLGGSVSGLFPRLAQAVATLREEGYRVCVDSHQPEDLRIAAAAGAELLLSVTSQNLEEARQFNCPVVVIPDDGESLDSLYRNIERLAGWGVDFVIDPILPPLTFGVAAAVSRYVQVRQDFPTAPMMMGLGNVTELSDCDSVGLNMALTAMAVELNVEYLLTTEVAVRCRGAVREVRLARDLCHRARLEGITPKHLDGGLLTIKEAALHNYDQEELLTMQEQIRDSNYRIFVADRIYVFNGHGFYTGQSADELFPQLAVKSPSHAFYLGRELDKAETALRLHKQYVQDASLDWGYLTGEGRADDGH